MSFPLSMQGDQNLNVDEIVKCGKLEKTYFSSLQSFSSKDLLLRMEKRPVRKESEENGQGSRACLCGKDYD